MTYCRSIEDFKATLQGGGVRPTMFQVELTFPDGVTPDSTQAALDGTFLIKAANLPAATIGSIPVPFRGRQLKVSGDRTFDDWTVTVINDVSFGLRMAFEEWSEKIQNFNYSCGANTLNDYFASAIVRQFDRDGNQLRAYRFEGIWPTNVDAIDLAFDSTNQIEEYQVTFAVQYFSAIDQGDPFTSAVSSDSTTNTRGIST